MSVSLTVGQHPWKLAYLKDPTEIGNTGHDMVVFVILSRRDCTLDGTETVRGQGYEVKRGIGKLFTSEVYFIFFEYP